MCGIYGMVGESGEKQEKLLSVRRLIGHRGPDAFHHLQLDGGNVLLAHARLAILDVSEKGNQPMVDDDTGNVIVLNGEIYNFLELRKDLEARGCRFTSHSDTEVLLKGYAAWGREVLQRLTGMFAFGLWDRAKRELFIARDRMGEKPLYYAEGPGGSFAFSSELKPLLLDSRASRDINGEALAHYIAYGYTATGSAIVNGVKKLPPAHWIAVRDGQVRETAEYWKLERFFQEKRAYRSFEEALECASETVERATRGQLVSDVPLGAFLSGGVDSGIVTAAMKRAAADVRTFSAGFDEPEFDERREAQRASEAIGTRHTPFSLGQPSFGDILAPYRACDEPFADTSAVPTYYLAKLTRANVTVCLSGDGGDELFGGYPTYLADKLYWATRLLPRSLFTAAGAVAASLPSRHGKVGLDYKLKAFLQGAALPFEGAHCAWRRLFSPSGCRAILSDDLAGLVEGRRPEAATQKYWNQLPDAHYLDRAMYVDMKTWLVDDVLFKVDRMTMAHALESRAPFLDHRLVEFAASLPVDYKIRGVTTKYILKELAARRYGLDYRGSRKKGFNAPVSRWIVHHLEEVRSYLMDSGLFRAAGVTDLLGEHAARRADNGFRIMGLLGLVAWKEGLAS
jgi:asparagine synthase (glutamine-hydrolysing)